MTEIPDAKRTALVAGATGLIGQLLTDRLIADPDYGRVIALVRSETGRKAPGYEEAVVDYEQLGTAFPQCAADDVFCALGTTTKKAGGTDGLAKVDRDYVAELAAMARGRDCRQFLMVSSVGASRRASSPYLRIKGEAEEAARRAGFESTHLFRPSLLLGKREEFRPGEMIGSWASVILNPLMIGGLQKYRGTESEDVANAMITAAKQDAGGVHIHHNVEISRLSAP